METQLISVDVPLHALDVRNGCSSCSRSSVSIWVSMNMSICTSRVLAEALPRNKDFLRFIVSFCTWADGDGSFRSPQVPPSLARESPVFTEGPDTSLFLPFWLAIVRKMKLFP